MKKIIELILLIFSLYIVLGYFFGFILILFKAQYIEGSLVLIAISLVDKVNEDRFKK